MEHINVLLIEPRRLCRDGLRLILRDPPYAIADASSVADYVGLQGERTPDFAMTPDLVIWGQGVSATSLEPGLATLRSRFAELAQPTRHVVLAHAPSATALRRLAALDVDALLLDDISGEVLQRSLELVMLGQRLFPVARRRPFEAPHTETPQLESTRIETTQIETIPIETTQIEKTQIETIQIETTQVETTQAEVLAFPTAPRRRQTDPGIAPKHQVVLSNRESQILQHLVDGGSNKAIARALQITEATVKVHVKALLRKVRATNRTQVAIWALHNQYRVVAAVDMPARGTG